MIQELFTKLTWYDFIKLKTTVACWVKTYIIEVVDEKIGPAVK